MRIEITSKTGTFTASLQDKLLFADNAAFRKLLEEVRTSGCPACVLDLSQLSAIDSAGLGMLMIAVDDARKHNWTLALRNPQGPVLKLLQLSRMDKLLKAA